MVNKRVLVAALFAIVSAVVSLTSAHTTHEKHIIHVPLLIHHIHHYHHKPILKPKHIRPKIKKIQTKKFIHRYHTYWY